MSDNNVVELPPKIGAMSSGGSVKAIVPQNLEDAFRLANMIVKAKMAPASFETPEAVLIAIMHGLEVGLPPLMALQSIAVINNRPTLWGDGAMALVRATGQLEIFDEWIDGAGDKMIAYCKIKRKGQNEKTYDFSVQDAKNAKLWGKAGPWTTFPRRMMAMRPRSWALRDTFADALKGLHIAEEVMDTDMKNITPSQSSSPPSPPPAPRIEEQRAQVSEPIVPDAAPVDQPEMPIAEMIADWESRLESAPSNIQDEIFETEIDPAHMKGWLSAPEYNSLTALVSAA